MMKYPDTAQFLWSVVKRSRKYFLGLTTITQDVEDFLSQDIGKAIVTNSALQLLLKQSPAAIDKVGEVFYLSQEKRTFFLPPMSEKEYFCRSSSCTHKDCGITRRIPTNNLKPQDLVNQQQAPVKTT